MNKRIQMTAIAVVLAAASTGAMAADNGAFFINGNLGQSRYHDSSFSNKTDTATAVRLGYDWNAGPFSFGAEGGYVDLGKAKGATYPIYGMAPVNFNVKTSGWLVGGNFKYHFTNNMYVSTRGGYFRSKFDMTVDGFGSQSFNGNGAYAGFGFGYDFNQHFSVGAGYDWYYGRVTANGVTTDENIDMFSATAEYRF